MKHRNRGSIPNRSGAQVPSPCLPVQTELIFIIPPSLPAVATSPAVPWRASDCA